MSKLLTQYRVFIGSPGGLDEERRKFRHVLEKCSKHHGEEKDIVFHPVGWEDTIGGIGRPQEHINEDLKQCDYAVFILHDRWGSPTGNGHTSGTEEEWALAEELYKATKIRNIALFFKKVDAGKLSDPGDQLKPVLAFKKKIEEGKRYLFKQYETLDEFADTLDGHLALWLKDHEGVKSGLSAEGLLSGTTIEGPADKKTAFQSPSFDYWMKESGKLQENVPDHAAILFCAAKAVDAAKTDIEWARARNALAVAKFHLSQPDEAITAFTEIADRLSTRLDADSRIWCGRALFNKGVTLGALGRSEEAIAVCDDVLARFGAATELPLREQVAKALFNKGITLGALGRSEEAIAVCDDVVARFGAATELSLREQVAKALFTKGFRLGALGRTEEALAAYDDGLARFGAAAELPLREQVAKALVNKGITLGALDRTEEALAVYNDVLARFGAAAELPLREQVAKALVNKGITLGALDRTEEALAVYNDVLARFGAAAELPLREQVAKALVNKGITLGALGRSEEAIAVYDDVLAGFGAATELPLREQVAKALFNKGVTLAALGRSEEAIAVYDDVLARFDDAAEPLLHEIVAEARKQKSAQAKLKRRKQ